MIRDHVLTNETVQVDMEVVVRDDLFHPAPFAGATGYVQVVMDTAPGFHKAVGVRLYHRASGPFYYKPYELKELPT